MSTRHTGVGKDQEAPPQDSRSIYTEETVQQEKVSPAERIPQFPQPPRRPSRTNRDRWFLVTAVGVALALILSIVAIVIAQLGQHRGSQVTLTPTKTATTVTPTPTGSDTTPTPPAGVVLGPQNGPTGVSDPAYWDQILGTKGTNGKVESVSFANVRGNPSLQALVTVRYSDANSTLDVYVFDKITNAHPTQLFKMQGLVKGDAKISGYNSILTAEVDQNSTLNAGKSRAQWTTDLFREFAWNAGEGTLTQMAFPGLFPDLTRYQAEADQARVSAGHDPWKNDPAQVARSLEERFFGWQRTVTTKLLGGGGSNDVYAAVQVQEAAVQGSHPSIVVTLSRLEGNTHNFWVAIGTASGTALTLTNIESQQLLTSPVTLEGTGLAFEALIGQAVVYDHLYADIGHAQILGSNGMGPGSYSTNVSYTSSFNGIQEGLVMVYQNNGGLSAENISAVMVKVLLNPEPGVTLGPVPGPDSVKDPSYWTPFVSAPPAIRDAYSVSFGHLLGKPSLQAMVVATDILGGGPVYRTIFVFDKITDPKPQLLFTVGHLLHGNARISGYSTIMTAEVDVNSSINKGKLEAGLTTDLFREFKWSDGAGIFVPTAFPGIFPDLTRYQAEMDQNNVTTGADSWKNDARQVASKMAAQFLKWSPNATTSILSGGGPQDVGAVVQVISANPGGSSINVTLSRLEGNTSNMWVVIGATSGHGALTITTPVKGDRLTSPTTITGTGTGSAFEAVIGQAFILDHLYVPIGQAQVTGASNGKTTYSTSVGYTSSFHNGVQEGVVVVYIYSQADGSIATAAMQKVMLSA